MSESIEDIEKSRYELLINAIEITKQKATVSKNGFYQFRKQYPLAFKTNENKLKSIYDQFMQLLQEAIDDECKLIMSKNKIEEKLNILDNLVKENIDKEGTIAWRGDYDKYNIYENIDIITHIENSIELLEEKKLEKQLENNRLRNLILKKRANLLKRKEEEHL